MNVCVCVCARARTCVRASCTHARCAVRLTPCQLVNARGMQVHPRVVAEHKTMILKCLNDEDITIRQRALDLVSGVCNLVQKSLILGNVRED